MQCVELSILIVVNRPGLPGEPEHIDEEIP